MTPDAGELAALVAAALPDEGLTAADLETCCYGPDTEILGDERGAAVVKVEHTAASLLLVAVHPRAQHQGVGRRLVDTAVALVREAGAEELYLGHAPERYLWPGVDFRFTPALALFESKGFQPTGAFFNMTLGTSFRAEPPPDVTVDRERGDGAVELAQRAFPHWEGQTARAVERGTCFAARNDTGTVGFACHSVNRAGWIGPMATDPDRQHGGVGRALLGAVCADLETRGHAEADIAWVGPVGFYAKCGARVSRVFRTAKLPLSTR